MQQNWKTHEVLAEDVAVVKHAEAQGAARRVEHPEEEIPGTPREHARLREVPFKRVPRKHGRQKGRVDRQDSLGLQEGGSGREIFLDTCKHCSRLTTDACSPAASQANRAYLQAPP